MSLQYLKNENMKAYCKLIVLFLMGLARHAQIDQVNLQWIEVKDLTALTGSNTALTIWYISNVLPPLTLFFSQWGIHTKLFLHLIIWLSNISWSISDADLIISLLVQSLLYVQKRSPGGLYTGVLKNFLNFVR